MKRRCFLTGTAALLAAPAFARTPAPAAMPAITGGLGGRIIRVTTLDADGPGSIAEAVAATGPRIVVFEVGGVIDLGRNVLRIRAGDITIAGQTAPSPGVTFIRGGVAVNADNVVIRHIAIRPGEAGAAKQSGWECDGLYTYSAARVEVSNCSITWATDEGLSASGPRFERDNAGATPADWRAATSHDIVFRANIVAEGLSHSTHAKGEHSKGTLIHDNVRNALVADSLYAHNRERNILFKGGAQGVMTRCVVYNAGKRFAHYNLHAREWEGRAHETGEVAITGNTFLAGPSTDAKAAAFMLGGEGDLVLAMANNTLRDATGGRLAEFGVFGSGDAKCVQAPPLAPAPLPAPEATLSACGARPWDRDMIDARIIADVRNGTGRIIDSEQEVGGYPLRPAAHASFVDKDWDLAALQRR